MRPSGSRASHMNSGESQLSSNPNGPHSSTLPTQLYPASTAGTRGPISRPRQSSQKPIRNNGQTGGRPTALAWPHRPPDAASGRSNGTGLIDGLAPSAALRGFGARFSRSRGLIPATPRLVDPLPNARGTALLRRPGVAGRGAPGFACGRKPPWRRNRGVFAGVYSDAITPPPRHRAGADHHREDTAMTTTPRLCLFASAALLAIAAGSSAQAQQSNMTFFVTSVGGGKGADLGGL